MSEISIVIKGGPRTGKTTIVNKILELFENGELEGQVQYSTDDGLVTTTYEQQFPIYRIGIVRTE